jgi:REP element-mobilizing transposase RayT
MSHDFQRPKRKHVRLPDYDYRRDGAYFITICTHERRCILAGIKGNICNLTQIGEIVGDEWLRTVESRENVLLDCFVVMPNHFHTIVWLEGGAGTTRRAPTSGVFGHPAAGSLSNIVRAFKAAVTRRVRLSKRGDDTMVWQRGFYEHVIRGDNDLYALREYIQNNPAKWALDSDNPASRPTDAERQS